MLLYLSSEWVVTFLRIVLGISLLAHGWPKAVNLRETARQFAHMGFRPGWLWGPVVAAVELIGGILLILGYGTGLVSLVLAIEFAVIVIWKLFRMVAYSAGGKMDLELDLLILGVLLLLLASGPGNLSLSGAAWQ
ncbi:MAG: DoxX family protein [Candidatus Liptonbacteria bacterium]|nr:DoxX family protein [Candidatus Liptonbacteria bacterium]